MQIYSCLYIEQWVCLMFLINHTCIDLWFVVNIKFNIGKMWREKNSPEYPDIELNIFNPISLSVS